MINLPVYGKIVHSKDSDWLLPIVHEKERQKECSLTCSKDYIGHILRKKKREKTLEQDTLRNRNSKKCARYKSLWEAVVHLILPQCQGTGLCNLWKSIPSCISNSMTTWCVLARTIYGFFKSAVSDNMLDNSTLSQSSIFFPKDTPASLALIYRLQHYSTQLKTEKLE